jgi:hypothetical protein
VQYQVHLPAPASASTADVYRRDPQVAMVIAATADQATISAVIINNITLQPGEVFGVLSVEQLIYEDRPIYQCVLWRAASSSIGTEGSSVLQ